VRRHLSRLLRCLCLLPLLALSSTSLSWPRDVHLAWTHSVSSGVAGYRIYYGNESGNYTGQQDTEYVTETIISGLADDLPWYFTATSFDGDGNESGVSNEAFSPETVQSVASATNVQISWSEISEPPMAIPAVVNSAAGSSDSTATTIAASALNVTTGNSLVCLIVAYNNPSRTVASIADTAGNAAKFSKCGSTYSLLDSGYTINIDIWLAKNVTGHASNVVTATMDATCEARRIIVVQVSGDIDLDASYAPGGTTDATSPHSTTAANTSAHDEIVIGGFLDYQGVVGGYSSSSPSVLITSVSNDFAAASNNAAAAGSWSVSVAATNTEGHACYAKAFKAAAGGATTGIHNPFHRPFSGPFGGPL